MCAKSPAAVELACEELLVKPTNVDDTTGDGEELQSLKRKREEYADVRHATCKQCNKEFDVTDNDEESCLWHPGNLYDDLDSSIWDDWDVETWGERDTEFNRAEYPEGFRWDCCEEIGTVEFCMATAHVAKPKPTPKVIKATDTADTLSSGESSTETTSEDAAPPATAVKRVRLDPVSSA